MYALLDKPIYRNGKHAVVFCVFKEMYGAHMYMCGAYTMLKKALIRLKRQQKGVLFAHTKLYS